MDYKRIYDNLIEKGRSRGKDKKALSYYTETHHIIPRCMGGNNKDDNLVLLTYREHIIAHLLLCEVYPENNLLKLAVFKMYQTKRPVDKEIKICTKTLEEIKISSINVIRELRKKTSWTKVYKRKKGKSIKVFKREGSNKRSKN